MSTQNIKSCAQCGVAGRVVAAGVIGFWVWPKTAAKCGLKKNPERRCYGSVAACCRSGMCSTRQDAIDMWNRMQDTPDVVDPR